MATLRRAEGGGEGGGGVHGVAFFRPVYVRERRKRRRGVQGVVMYWGLYFGGA
jgi:hypothetical protein